jgi:hypothetical protein
MNNQKNDALGNNKYLKKQVTKKFIPKFICMQKFFGEKKHAILFKSNPFGS